MTKKDGNFTEIFIFSEIQQNAQIEPYSFKQKHKNRPTEKIFLDRSVRLIFEYRVLFFDWLDASFFIAKNYPFEITNLHFRRLARGFFTRILQKFYETSRKQGLRVEESRKRTLFYNFVV